MKNTIKIVAIILLPLFLATRTDAQYRSVYWLHGLNGEADRWKNYADYFQGERQMESFRPEYSSTGSVNQITDGIDGEFTPAPDNIGIGASLGGIVLRNLELRGNDVNELGGVITTHSPNLGAAIATAVNNGEAEEHLIKVVSTLSVAVEEIDEHLLTGGNTTWTTITGALNTIFSTVNEILNTVIEMIASGNELPSEEDITSQITTAFNIISNPASQNIFQDIDPTNSFMSDLNNFPSTLPRIEVHGYETDKEPFRMGCSQDSRVWTLPLAEVDAVPDDTCKVFQDLKDAESSLNNAQLALNIKGGLNVLNPFSWLNKKRRSTELFEAASDVNAAKDMINHGIEQGWEALMFQSVPQVVTSVQPTAACLGYVEFLEGELAALEVAFSHCKVITPNNCSALEQQIAELLDEIEAIGPTCYEEVQTVIYVNDPDAKYDGLFLDAEQVTGSALAEYENSPILVNGKLEGVNHVEALKHPSTWNNLNLIFDRPDFFNTPPK